MAKQNKNTNQDPDQQTPDHDAGGGKKTVYRLTRNYQGHLSGETFTYADLKRAGLDAKKDASVLQRVS